jgi:glyoxylase-like metal-dependent hydrolase (beta-lactamase superfamily II)
MITKQTFQSLKRGFTWCYLVKCSDGYLLIDTSYPTCFHSFQKHMENRGIDIAAIKYLLLTHHHDDHAGFAAELVKETGCRVIVHRNAVSALKQGQSETTGKALNRRVQMTLMFYTLYYALFHQDTYTPLILSDRDIPLEGDSESCLTEIGLDGVILHTPGHTHTRDSISVLLSDGSAFVGDAAMNFLWCTGSRHRPIYIGDINTVYDSWQKLREHGAKVIYPAHGKTFSIQELTLSLMR